MLESCLYWRGVFLRNKVSVLERTGGHIIKSSIRRDLTILTDFGQT